MNAIMAAWFIHAWVAILWAARVALADLRQPRRDDDQQSWAVPEQRISGRL